MKRLFIFTVWLIVSIAVYTIVAAGLTLANTFVNIVCFIIGVMYIGITFKTNCFQKIFNKNEKDS